MTGPNLQKTSDRANNSEGDRENNPEVEIQLNWLDESYARLLAIADIEQRKKAFETEAENSGLSRELYRKGFESYQKEQEDRKNSQTFLLRPVSLLDAKVADFVHWFQDISFVKLAAVLSESALLFAIVSYAIATPARNEKRIQEAREILLEESASKYSEARISALKVLQKYCAGNPGLLAPEARMSHVNFGKCSRFSLGWQQLGKWPPTLFVVQPLNLSYSQLTGANLEGANLEGINLQGSNLAGANLSETNLEGANLEKANLEGANFARANLKGANLKHTILDRSIFYGATLENADFSEASLVGANALWANFSGVNFYRANLQGANLTRSQLHGTDFYKADLTNALLRFTDLQGEDSLREANFRDAQLLGADFWGARFASTFQIKRGNHWDKARKVPNWSRKISVTRLPRLRIGLIKPKPKQTLFEAYELGMRRAANRRVEIWTFEAEDGVEPEAQTIQKLIDFGIDAIVLTPEDPEDSMPALQDARDAGIAIVTVDFCFDRQIAEDLAIACYNTNSYQMGYDSGTALAEWVNNYWQVPTFRMQQSDANLVRVGVVDGTAYDRYYPYLKGFLDAVENEDVPLEIVDSVGIEYRRDIDKVVEMLTEFPDLDLLWGGSNLATEVTIEGVKRLDLEDRVAIFGILDLSRERAQMLLDPESPLQLIIDQAGVHIGYSAAKMAIAVLRGERSGEEYEEFVPPHRVLTQDDKEAVRELLREANSID